MIKKEYQISFFIWYSFLSIYFLITCTCIASIALPYIPA
ncbi:putative membrane protein [[Clostridium] sordellii VPI 9048]|nr:putative membrane protein [[Clostridium] sordellii VPI 9048] [Paeniclostridium sordellii VPI 9048]